MEITSDSCYSGKLCYAARDYWGKKNHNYPKTLKIIASCHGN